MTDNTDDQTHELDEDAQAGLAQMLAGNAEPSLEDFKPSMPGNINPEILQNISVTLSIEVGRAQIKIKDLMRLTQGSVVELDRIAGEPLDLLVNNSVVAQGEIVLVNDRYGVRLTRVVPSSERLKLI
ncbi:flagellar motor switch protein FliN [Limnohabitans sp. TS-CS-82]|jgi:flagellar motor switch protein FliN|uniref:flagellar motor switch protein FliN n=1 Tax=Limnohabitans sp. TS-CS-82 TaxID=2094193 RepID=UPI001F01C688|nr:flagellar motor switch protein FliN [Limnohabitans sp. TS-CS-82]